VYLIAEIDLQFGRIAEFNEIMGQIVPILEKEGWKLEAAYMTIVGRVGHVIDIFEVGDANEVTSVQAAVRSHGEFRDLMARFVDVVDEERTMLAVRTPYSR
jgi:uncharacterized protein with GYD domain